MASTAIPEPGVGTDLQIEQWVPPSESGGDISSETITIPVGITLKEVAGLIIEATFRHTHGNISRTARVLGIDRTTLYNKLREYQIHR